MMFTTKNTNFRDNLVRNVIYLNNKNGKDEKWKGEELGVKRCRKHQLLGAPEVTREGFVE